MIISDSLTIDLGIPKDPMEKNSICCSIFWNFSFFENLIIIIRKANINKKFIKIGNSKNNNY
jgi:hypothetical protein